MKSRVKRIIFIVALGVLGAIALVRSPMRFQTNLTSLLNIEMHFISAKIDTKERIVQIIENKI